MRALRLFPGVTSERDSAAMGSSGSALDVQPSIPGCDPSWLAERRLPEQCVVERTDLLAPMSHRQGTGPYRIWSVTVADAGHTSDHQIQYRFSCWTRQARRIWLKPRMWRRARRRSQGVSPDWFLLLSDQLAREDSFHSCLGSAGDCVANWLVGCIEHTVT
jgi:hypothetical protein